MDTPPTMRPRSHLPYLSLQNEPPLWRGYPHYHPPSPTLEQPCLLWIGQKQALTIFDALLPNVTYPDQGSHAEVYTNPDPLKYVELEMLDPLHEMRVGDKLRATRTYTLIRRQSPEPTAEARRILGL